MHRSDSRTARSSSEASQNLIPRSTKTRRAARASVRNRMNSGWRDQIPSSATSTLAISSRLAHAGKSESMLSIWTAIGPAAALTARLIALHGSIRLPSREKVNMNVCPFPCAVFKGKNAGIEDREAYEENRRLPAAESAEARNRSWSSAIIIAQPAASFDELAAGKAPPCRAG